MRTLPTLHQVTATLGVIAYGLILIAVVVIAVLAIDYWFRAATRRTSQPPPRSRR